MAGRPPKPVNAIDNSVSRRTKKELEIRKASEPTIVAPCDFRCPKTLSLAAKKIWKELIKLHGKLSKPIWNDFDIPILSRYCEHRAMHDQLQERWSANAEVIKYDIELNGSMNEVAAEMLKLSKMLNSEEDKLCISVVGRARVGTAKVNGEATDDYDEMLD